jgi:hypothetical protein
MFLPALQLLQLKTMLTRLQNCQNITVQLDATGNATIVAGDVNNGSSDACGIASMTISTSSFTCTNIGANNVTLTITDVNGTQQPVSL